MAYVTPGTVTAGDVATAAAWNVLTNDIIQIAGLAQGVFTNEAAREAAITSPTEGMIAYLTAPTVPAATGATTAVPTGVRTVYNGSVWVCVTPVGANSDTSGTTTSTSYVTTLTGDATAVSVTLVTGTTAHIMMNTTAANSTSGTNVYLAYSVSGASTVTAAAATECVFTCPSAGGIQSPARAYIITGLTAGTNTFTLNYRVSANTGTYTHRQITVSGVA